MNNTKEDLALIKQKKVRIRLLTAEAKNISGEIATLKREVKDLDAATKARKQKLYASLRVQAMVRNQDLVVNALRKIGRPAGAGTICEELKNVGIICHNSEFATRFLPDVRLDKRVKVREVNASKNEYSLAEWTK